MKVRAGTLTDQDRATLFESNRSGRRVSVHTDHACIEYSQHQLPGCEENGCYVGVVTTWDYDSFKLGGWSFTVNIPWESARHVWWRDEYPRSEDGEERCPVDDCRSNRPKVAA